MTIEYNLFFKFSRVRLLYFKLLTFSTAHVRTPSLSTARILNIFIQPPLTTADNKQNNNENCPIPQSQTPFPHPLPPLTQSRKWLNCLDASMVAKTSDLLTTHGQNAMETTDLTSRRVTLALTQYLSRIPTIWFMSLGYQMPEKTYRLVNLRHSTTFFQSGPIRVTVLESLF